MRRDAEPFVLEDVDRLTDEMVVDELLDSEYDWGPRDSDRGLKLVVFRDRAVPYVVARGKTPVIEEFVEVVFDIQYQMGNGPSVFTRLAQRLTPTTEDNYKNRFPLQWEKYTNKKSGVKTQTTLDVLGLSEFEIEHLRIAKITSVELLAKAKDEQLAKVQLPNTKNLKVRAERYLSIFEEVEEKTSKIKAN